MSEDLYEQMLAKIAVVDKAMRRARRRLQIQSFLIGAMGAYIIQGWIR